jgi:hypothetical protein
MVALSHLLHNWSPKEFKCALDVYFIITTSSLYVHALSFFTSHSCHTLAPISQKINLNLSPRAAFDGSQQEQKPPLDSLLRSPPGLAYRSSKNLA